MTWPAISSQQPCPRGNTGKADLEAPTVRPIEIPQGLRDAMIGPSEVVTAMARKAAISAGVKVASSALTKGVIGGAIKGIAGKLGITIGAKALGTTALSTGVTTATTATATTVGTTAATAAGATAGVGIAGTLTSALTSAGYALPVAMAYMVYAGISAKYKADRAQARVYRRIRGIYHGIMGQWDKESAELFIKDWLAELRFKITGPGAQVGPVVPHAMDTTAAREAFISWFPGIWAKYQTQVSAKDAEAQRMMMDEAARRVRAKEAARIAAMAPRERPTITAELFVGGKGSTYGGREAIEARRRAIVAEIFPSQLPVVARR